MYEKFTEAPVSFRQFSHRMIGHLLIAFAVLALSLFIGTVGYVHFMQMPWQEAFLNATMLLSGIGLANFPDSPDAQLFVSIYALYAGLVFLVMTSIILAPILHRFLHHFHWVDSND